MTCGFPVPFYIPASSAGITLASSDSNGDGIRVGWSQAYANPTSYLLGYNIYFSTDRDSVFAEEPKYLSIGSTLALDITSFTPGDIFYFAVRATQFDPSWIDLTSMPISGDSFIYPEGILLNSMSDTDGYINVSDINTFPNFGVVQIGDELIQYLNKDIVNNLLTGLIRGFLNTNIRFHRTDGYDGYFFENPLVRLWDGLEEGNQKVFESTSTFAYPNYAVTVSDGYHNRTEDILNTDLAASDQVLIGVPAYDFRGWHRINPKDAITGKCVGSYFGGERFCADGYGGVGRMLRGTSITDVNLAREEVGLNNTGEPCILVKKIHTGVFCNCYIPTKEYPDDRCPNCLGSGFQLSWQQFFNSRRSDGRILVRFDPAVDDVPYFEAGMESTYAPTCWTLAVPTIHDRDMLIRYDKYTNQEVARFEVLNVTRNVTLDQVQGAQKFAVVKVRKTDSFYKFNVFSDSSNFPSTISTSIGSTPGLILPHVHSIQISEKIVSITQINQVTQQGGATLEQYHSHDVRNGIVQPALGHTHNIVII